MKYTITYGSIYCPGLSHYELNSHVQELLDMGADKKRITITVDE
jgi:hypothetical protein